MKSSLTRGMVVTAAVAVIGATLGTTASIAQESQIEQSAVTLSSGGGGRAELWFQFADGAEHRLALEDGEVVIDGSAVGGYETGGVLITRWRDFLRQRAGADAATFHAELDAFAARLAEWEPGSSDGDVAKSFRDRIVELLRTEEAKARDTQESSEASSMTGESDGFRLAIAPGGVEFDELLDQLERLRRALRKLGTAGEEATDHLALIVHDDFSIGDGEVVEGNLALLGGTLRVSGEVGGHVLVLGGSLVLTDGARVNGDILQVGGDLRFEGDAHVIEGEIVSDFASIEFTAEATEAAVVAVAPSVSRDSGRSGRYSSNPVRRFARNLGHAAEDFIGALSTFITLGVLGLLLIYFAQTRVEMVADTVRHEFARSFAMGLAGEVLFFPAVLVLFVLVITWPIIPFFVLGTGLAMLAGYIAVAHGAGEMFAQRRYRYEWLERLRRSNSYYYVLNGLVLLLVPFAAAAVLWILGGPAGFVRGIVTFVAAVGTWILVTAGFGSVLLTRAGTRSVVVDWSDGAVEPGDEPILETGPVAETEPTRETDGSDD